MALDYCSMALNIQENLYGIKHQDVALTYSLIENKFDEVGNLPKEIVLIKDGVISKHHFEKKMGARINSKFIEKEEKKQLIEAYQQWVERNYSFFHLSSVICHIRS